MTQLIAIDPGTTQSAVLVWDGVRPTVPMIMPNEKLRTWLRECAPFPIAIEMIASMGMPVGAETFQTVLFIGQLKEIWEQRGLPFKLVYRREVKLHLCGTMKAKDGNIRQRLIDMFGPVGTKKNKGALYGINSHLWQALGVAVTAFDQAKTDPDYAKSFS